MTTASPTRFAGPTWLLAVFLQGCGPTVAAPEPSAPAAASVGGEAPMPAAPRITEVAQRAAYGGSTADKVEVHCEATAGCGRFRVCDTASEAESTSCSAEQPALALGEVAVISRGSSITDNDAVWIVDGPGSEVEGTRVASVACPAGSSRRRSTCGASGAFAPCGELELGAVAPWCASAAAGETSSTPPYAVAFTLNQGGLPEGTCTRPLCKALVQQIEQAATTIDFAVYGIRDQQGVVDALVAARARGVRVRGLVDTEDATCSSKFGYPDTPALRQALGADKVVCDTGGGYSHIMHNKFFIFDGKAVWTGSTNISDTELGGEYNTDVAALLRSPALASVYTTEFDEMFQGRRHKRKTDNTVHEVDVAGLGDITKLSSYFSPSDDPIAHAVLPLISAATRTLDIAMFFFTSKSIADAILAARTRGVSVRMILDAGGAGNSASKHGALCVQGIPVKVENWGGKSHSKWAVADAGLASAAVVFGSMNWTEAGNLQNDENTLYVASPGVAAAFHGEFDRQWADLTSVPVCTLIAAEGATSSHCTQKDRCGTTCDSGSCCDGSDNDYDGHADAAEEACSCGDGVDNDDNGYIDATDFQCRAPAEDP